MIELLAAVGSSLLVGWMIGRHFHRMSVHKSVGVYARTDAKLFTGVADALREDLSIRFRGAAVGDIHQLELVVANDGERTVGNFRAPIKIQLPDEHEILDAALLDLAHGDMPFALTLDGVASASGLSIDLPFLNRGDWLVVKMLVTPPVELAAVSVFTLAEDLDPRVRVQPMPPRSAGQTWIERLQMWLLFLAFLAVMPVAFVGLRWLTPELLALTQSLGMGGSMLGILTMASFVLWLVFCMICFFTLAKGIEGLGGALGAIFPVGKLTFPASYYQAVRPIAGREPGSITVSDPR